MSIFRCRSLGAIAFRGDWRGHRKSSSPRSSPWCKVDPLAALLLPTERQVKELERAGHALGVKLLVRDIRTADDLPVASGAGARERAEGVLTTAESLFVVQRERVVQLAAQHRLPGLYPYRLMVDAGGLIAYDSYTSNLQARNRLGRVTHGAQAPGRSHEGGVRRIVLSKLNIVYRDWHVEKRSPFWHRAPNAGKRRSDARSFDTALLAALLGGLSEAIEKNNHALFTALGRKDQRMRLKAATRRTR